jgi:hypothetical protein
VSSQDGGFTSVSLTGKQWRQCLAPVTGKAAFEQADVSGRHSYTWPNGAWSPPRRRTIFHMRKMENEEKFEKIGGGTKSNLEHFLLLQLLPNLHEF